MLQLVKRGKRRSNNDSTERVANETDAAQLITRAVLGNITEDFLGKPLTHLTKVVICLSSVAS